MVDIKYIEDWFLNFSHNFLSGDEERDKPLELKINHTLRVVQNVRWLLSDERQKAYEHHDFIDLKVCIIAAYLHDVGRFEQYKKYGTFDDRVSIDHGDLSAEIVQRENLLAGLDEIRTKVILYAVRYHNKKVPPIDLGDVEKVNLGVLRDADKMDVFYILSTLAREGRRYGLSGALLQDVQPSHELSPAVMEEFLGGSLVSFGNVRTFEDLQLLRISWIYDFNSPWALIRLWGDGYVQDIIEGLEHKEMIYPVVKREVDNAISTVRKA